VEQNAEILAILTKSWDRHELSVKGKIELYGMQSFASSGALTTEPMARAISVAIMCLQTDGLDLLSKRCDIRAEQNGWSGILSPRWV
jgi:hypothetical protein